MRRTSTCLVFIILACLLQSCSTGTKPVAASPLQDGLSPAQCTALAKLNALTAPTGTDPAVFNGLKSAFAEMIADGLVNLTVKQASAGMGIEIDDLNVSDLGGGTMQLTWTYRHLGDYDRNSQVTVSDISPVGQYYNATSASPNWAIARAADGDNNGLVSVSDLTPVGQNFGSIVTGYEIQSSTAPSNPSSWSVLTEVPFSQGVRAPGQADVTFTAQLTGQAAGTAYRVTALTTSSGGTDPTYDEREDNDTYSTPQALPAGNVSGFQGSLGNGPGYSGYDGDSDDLFSFTAETGQDVDIVLNFNGTTADLDLYLLNTAGDTLLSSLGTGSTEEINATINSGGTFLIAVQAYDGYSDYTLDVTFSAAGFSEPPVETFTDYSSPGDSAARKWLLNCYRVLPPWQDSDRCFQSPALSAWADEVLTITNQHRALSGLNPLTLDPHLELVAQAHARDMALQGYFSHDNLYGMAYTDRLDAVNRPPYTTGAFVHAENIYAGRKDPVEDSAAGAVAWWMNSPGHRANMLNPDVTHIGIGVYYHTGDPEGYYAYFTQVFANWSVDPAGHDWLEPAEVPGP